VETAIYRTIRDAVPGKTAPETEPHLGAHVQIDRLARKVRRESHRMKGFIRFQRIAEDRYLALIEPRYDVLPLLRHHFESRFVDQQWIIYDRLRNYGLCRDRHATRELRLDVEEIKALCENRVSEERFCLTLWKRYYTGVNITQRNNRNLHLRQLPRRYWRYLPEKNA
jgi:probable DNA metabolism protein